MKNFNTIMDITQIYLTENEVKKYAQYFNYIDTARKFTVYNLLEYFIAAAVGEWKGYRDGADNATTFGLTQVDYSTFSKKASKVPYEIFKELFHLLLGKLNRKTKRILGIDKKLIAVDSTTISVGENRLKWAKFHGKKSAIKLHVGLDISNLYPHKVVETIGKKHDGPIGENFIDTGNILIEDRAYAKINRFDYFNEIKQGFVVRIKNNFTLVQTRKLKSLQQEDSNIIRDITCKLGKNKNQSKNRFRVVIFNDDEGHEMRIATNILNCPPELIADIYKERWKIETFFRFIKQNLNASRIFGTTQNAVYSQLYCSLIAYVLVHFMYNYVSEKCLGIKSSRIEFLRSIRTSTLKVEFYVCIYNLINKRRRNTVIN